jgi:hypothetical protein
MTVLEAAVLEELLAVIGGEHNQRLLEDTSGGKGRSESTQLLIDERDLLVVRGLDELAILGGQICERSSELIQVSDRQREP